MNGRARGGEGLRRNRSFDPRELTAGTANAPGPNASEVPNPVLAPAVGVSWYAGVASRLVRLLELAREVAAEAAAQPDPDACLHRLRTGLLRLGFSRAGIWVTDPEDPGSLHGTWGTSWRAEEVDEHSLRFPFGSFLASDQIAGGKKVNLCRFSRPSGDSTPPHVVDHEPDGPPNQASVGMRADGELLGIISVDMLIGTEAIAADHVIALEFLADQVAVAIARGRAVAKLRVTNDTLRADVAARKKVEEALRDSNYRLGETLDALTQTQQRVIQQERLRALGQMASGVAHDFNNALAQILGYIELLLEVNPDAMKNPEIVKSYL